MERITKARTALLLSQPFFGTLALQLRIVMDPSVKTMKTDGVHLWANPAFVEGLSLEQLKGVLAHEIMHPACRHHTRRGSRSLRLWNVAADYAINPMLLSAGFELPEGALNEPRFEDMSAEAIYATLNQPGGSGGDDSQNGAPGGDAGAGGDSAPPADDGQPDDAYIDPGGCGGVCDAPGVDGRPPSPADRKHAERQWDVAVSQALEVAKGCGQLPAGIERFVTEVRTPTIYWTDVLRAFFHEIGKDRYSWTRPDRRFIHAGLYLPGRHSRNLGPVVVAVDSSASIDPPTVAQFSAETSAILETCRPSRIDVVYCDSTIGGVETFSTNDLPLKLQVVGGGGTDFRPPFEWVESEGLSPACMVYLTDLESSRFPPPPAYPVLWAAIGKRTAPFGDIVRLGGGA